ncbi:MAG: hypothetical protein KDD51_01455 [Bdellovibrionales bacterium]|nr:hypothetical protein [Bdellovibrionales bacterium]
MSIFAAIGVFYSLLWWFVAAPLFSTPETSQLYFDLNQVPFLKLTLSILGFFLPKNAFDPGQLLAVHNLLCNAMTLVALGVLVHLLHEKLSVALTAVFLFAVSTWPAFYLFSTTEAPLSAFLAVLSLCFTVLAFGLEQPTFFWLSLAGLCSGLQTSLSSAGFAFFLCLSTAVYLLSAAWKHSMRWKWLGVYVGASVMTFGGGALVSHGALWEGIRARIEYSSFLEELSQLGVVQKIPFGSFFFIGGYYAPSLVFAGLLGALLFSFIFLDMKRRRTLAERILFLMSLMVLVYPLLIDLFPVSRTASLHFPVYPILIAVIVLVGRYWLEGVSQKKQVFVGVFAVFVLVTVGSNVWHTAELVRVRNSNAELVSKLTHHTDVYMLRDDIHLAVLESWLKKPVRKISNPDELPGNGVLLIGPHGAGSAKTAYASPSAKDYSPSLRKPETVRSYSTPYVGLFPMFLFENEIASAFYFSGTAPSRDQRNLHLTFWVYPDSAVIQ